MKIFRNLLVLLTLSFSLAAPAFAVLPSFPENSSAFDADRNGEITSTECKQGLDTLYNKEDMIETYMKEQSSEFVQEILACGIKSGNIKFWMVPYYITFALNFLIGLAGIISVLMILVGAYFYIAGGISDDKEKGKTVIKYAIFGLILTSLAWIVVNFILLLITS